MVNATYFSYDGVFSGVYGLQIAEFDVNSVEENEAFSPTLTTLKVPSLLRFYHGGVEYESPPTAELTVLSENVIPPELRSSILSWLIGRNSYKPLRFMNDDWKDFVYYCVFTGSQTIYVNGECHGFRLTATFDSPFARGIPTTATITGSGSITINNKSDVKDGYVYPTVEFTGGGVTIINTTDHSTRAFTFGNYTSNGQTHTLSSNGKLIVNCETKVIESYSRSNGTWSRDNGEKLSYFTSKNWLRLRPGNNTLSVTTNGTVTITCPWYAMIGY